MEVTMFSASSSPPSSVHYELPVPVEESSMGEPTIEDQPVDGQPPPLTFEVIEGASKRGQEKLFDSRGHSYCVKRRRNEITYWHCSVRGKSNHCPASVIQHPEGFTIGVEHNHTGEVGLPETAKLTAAIKRKATDDLFRPASAIINELLLQGMETAAAMPTLARPEHLARAANRCRQSKRPQDPVDLDFTMDESNIPEGFLRADIETCGKRHLIFATEEQLTLLSKAKRWYVDGTFKLCCPPFTQLFTINAFVRQDDHAKQVPLLFVLMSSKRKHDYKKVLKKVLRMLPTTPSVEQVTADFESAVWGAFRKVLPEVQLLGCAFHWNQALWRKVQELGLQTAYMRDRATNGYIRRLMAIPFLPHETIAATFDNLKPEAITEPLQQLVSYIEENWIRSTIWPPKCWSVFMQSIRTNNDIEGWHHGLNRRAAGRCGLPLYMFVALLHKEARLVSLQICLVSERKLKRMQRSTYQEVQRWLFELWEAFNKKEKSLRQLLKGCANINRPVMH